MSAFENITPYGICGATGFVFGILYLLIICKWQKRNLNDYIYIYVWSALGAIAGAKILYVALQLPSIVKSLLQSDNIYESIKSIMSAGFVFYGGLIGAIISICLACKYFGLKKEEAFKILMPAMPLAHAIGRIGCAIVGCCYGIEIKHGPGIIYNKSDLAPLGVKLFPVQIVEAIGDILIFFLLLYIIKKGKSGYVVLKIYLISYALLRFFLEFLRGDIERGKWGIMSTSQWISLIIIVVVLSVSLKNARSDFKT